MGEWIEINLPWRVVLPYPETKYPDMTAKVKEHFGYSESDLDDKYFPDHDEFIIDHPTFKEYDSIRTVLENAMAGKKHTLNDLKNKLAASDNAAVKTVLAYRAARKEIREWIEQHPDWIAACDRSDVIMAEHKARESQLSFRGRGLNNPGTIIEVEEDGQVRQLIIGHINTLGGVCDDCPDIRHDSIVRRYKSLV